MNFLFRGGPHRLEEKGREKKEGGAHSRIGCAASSGGLCGNQRPNMGFTLVTVCVKWLERTVGTGGKNFQSGIKYRRVRKVSDVSIRVRPAVGKRGEAFTGNSDFHTPWTHWDSKTEKASCWILLHWPGVSNLEGQCAWKVCLVTSIRSSLVQNLGWWRQKKSFEWILQAIARRCAF